MTARVSAAMRLRIPWRDLVLAAVCAGLSVAFLVEAADLPDPPWEPLGPGALPRAVAILFLAFAVLIAARAVIVREPVDSGERYDRSDLAARHSLLAVLYAAAVGFGLVDFAISTSIFLFLAGWMLFEFARRAALPTLVLALVLGFGTKWLFTEQLYIRLP